MWVHAQSSEAAAINLACTDWSLLLELQVCNLSFRQKFSPQWSNSDRLFVLRCIWFAAFQILTYPPLPLYTDTCWMFAHPLTGNGGYSCLMDLAELFIYTWSRSQMHFRNVVFRPMAWQWKECTVRMYQVHNTPSSRSLASWSSSSSFHFRYICVCMYWLNSVRWIEQKLEVQHTGRASWCAVEGNAEFCTYQSLVRRLVYQSRRKGDVSSCLFNRFFFLWLDSPI